MLTVLYCVSNTFSPGGSDSSGNKKQNIDMAFNKILNGTKQTKKAILFRESDTKCFEFIPVKELGV